MVVRTIGLIVMCGLVACAGAATSDGETSAPAALSQSAPTADAGAEDATAEDAGAPDAADAPENFLTVRPGLYRGGHPSAAGIAYLKSLGIARIVDLEIADYIEATPEEIDQELTDAKAAGITEFQHPMSAFEPAISSRFDADQDAITALLATATPDDPIYVHCKHGQDRTGLVIGLERVFGEQWQPADAHAEMVKIGFHTYFAGLEEYFENKTGWEDD